MGDGFPTGDGIVMRLLMLLTSPVRHFSDFFLMLLLMGVKLEPESYEKLPCHAPGYAFLHKTVVRTETPEEVSDILQAPSLFRSFCQVILSNKSSGTPE